MDRNSVRSSDSRDARPGLFVAWEWVGLAVAAYLARWLTASATDSRGLINLVVASAVSVGGLAVYQAAAENMAGRAPTRSSPSKALPSPATTSSIPN